MKKAFFIFFLLLGGCVHHKLPPALHKKCSDTLTKFLPKFGISDSIEICTRKQCRKGSVACVTCTSYLFGFWKNYTIEIESPDNFFGLSKDVQEFIICHELAHIKLGHVQTYYIWDKPPQQNVIISQQQEYDADALAVKIIGHPWGAITLPLNCFLIMLFIILIITLPIVIVVCFFIKNRFRLLGYWVLFSLVLTICWDMRSLLFSTHPPHLFRIFHVLRSTCCNK